MKEHDIIVIGSSAGGIGALRQLCAQLPLELPAAICLVQHSAPDGPGLLSQILAGQSPMPVVMAVDGMPLALGTIHVAPPDRHLLVDPGRLRVVRGPRENLHRPAIDPLFRSAASAYGERVIGMVLTGMLHDGTAGLQAVKSCGGITMVQDPDEAPYPSMPLSALHHVVIDHCLPIDGLARQLALLAGEPTVESQTAGGQRLGEEAQLADGNRHEPLELDRLGRRSAYTCPECHGALWEMDEEAVLRFRCHVGHAFTCEALHHGQTEYQERALWAATRALEEQALLLTRLGRRSRELGNAAIGERFELRAELHRRDAVILRDMLKRDDPPTVLDPRVAQDADAQNAS